MNIFENFSKQLVSLSRRHLLQLPMVAACSAFLRDSKAALITSPDTPVNPLVSLPSYLDSLIPGYLGPSATQQGVNDHFLDIARSNGQYRKLLIVGCQWLDQMAFKTNNARFLLLAEPDRIKIIQQAEVAASDSVERIFFERTRRDAFRFYYAQAESWRYLNFTGPPQPIGYPDYSRPVMLANEQDS